MGVVERGQQCFCIGRAAQGSAEPGIGEMHGQFRQQVQSGIGCIRRDGHGEDQIHRLAIGGAEIDGGLQS